MKHFIFVVLPNGTVIPVVAACRAHLAVFHQTGRDRLCHAVWTLLGTILCLLLAGPVLAQEGQVLTELENQLSSAAKGWEATIMDAARSLFWILATIEIGIAAVWLALQAASLDSWFAELVRRIMFVGFFAFVLDRGPTFARTVVDSLFQIGAASGSASPSAIFDAGIQVAGSMSTQISFGIFEDNILAVAAVIAMVIVVVCFSLIAAIFVAVMAEMYVGLLAGMIMLGLGGSSFTKDFAVRYLVYAFSVGMKLMALVMIARIGSEVLLGLSSAQVPVDQQFITCLSIAGISVVVFMVSIYVPGIIQGMVQGVSVTGGMEVIRHGGQAVSLVNRADALSGVVTRADFGFAQGMNPRGSAWARATLNSTGLAGRGKPGGSSRSHAGSALSLANSKLDGLPPEGSG